jgi:putative thioredoxin
MGFELSNFEEDVLKASTRKPVLVDFWAPWCGPCRTLGPIIEKLAHEEADKWTLVKINSDEHQDLSRKYDVKGIPAVKLFHNGQVIDEFTGVLPEYAIRQWLEKALPSPAKKLVADAEKLLEVEDEYDAKLLLEEALVLEPTNPTACGLLAGLIVFEDVERAAELAKTAATGEARFLSLGSAIEQIAFYAGREDLQTLSSEAGAEHYIAAVEAVRSGKPSEALPLLIEVLKTNRYLDDDGARKLGVALFTILGPMHPATQANRRTFDMWLY